MVMGKYKLVLNLMCLLDFYQGERKFATALKYNYFISQ